MPVYPGAPQSSTGPQTAAGKATSSRNSLKHGMYSKIALLEAEDREEYLEFTTAIKADLKAVGSVQEEFAQVIADNFWRHATHGISHAGPSKTRRLARKHLPLTSTFASTSEHAPELRTCVFLKLKTLRHDAVQN